MFRRFKDPFAAHDRNQYVVVSLGEECNQIFLPIQCGSKLAYDTRIRVNSTGFFSGKFLPWLVFWFVLRVVFGIEYAVGRFCG